MGFLPHTHMGAVTQYVYMRLGGQVALLQALGKGNCIVVLANDKKDGPGKCFQYMGTVGAMDHGLVILNQGLGSKVPSFFYKLFY